MTEKINFIIEQPPTGPVNKVGENKNNDCIDVCVWLEKDVVGDIQLRIKSTDPSDTVSNGIISISAVDGELVRWGSIEQRFGLKRDDGDRIVLSSLTR